MNNLLQEFRQAVKEWEDKLEEVKPFYSKVQKLRNLVESKIMNDGIYLPYSELIKLNGNINSCSMIVEQHGYRHITLEFSCYYIKDGHLEPITDGWTWQHDNVYTQCFGEAECEYKILGCYDLVLNGKMIEETKLDSLWGRCER